MNRVRLYISDVNANLTTEIVTNHYVKPPEIEEKPTVFSLKNGDNERNFDDNDDETCENYGNNENDEIEAFKRAILSCKGELQALKSNYYMLKFGSMPVISTPKRNFWTDLIGRDESMVTEMNSLMNGVAILRGSLIAGNKEYDLEQKIELEIKMREGTTRLLAACRHQTQTLEAAKTLLTSNERMTAYMTELQRRKKNNPTKLTFNGISNQSTGRVSLSDLRMPLIWRDTDHFKNKGDYRRFAVFCLAKIGTEIYDTTLLCPIDRALTDLTFPDTIIFTQIPANFELKLEVYSHILHDDLSIASTPRKIKKTIHSSISRTVGKKLAASIKDELNHGKLGPNFQLMASAVCTLDDAHDLVRTHDLKTYTPKNRTYQLPLFGHFCCRLAVQPDTVAQPVHTGELTLIDAKLRKFVGYWAQLQAFHLDVWEKKEHWDRGKSPVKRVAIRTGVELIADGNREIIIIEGEKTWTLKLKTANERDEWLRRLTAHLNEYTEWKHCSEKIMSIQIPSGAGNARNNFTLSQRQTRHGSLYDETPLNDSPYTKSTEFAKPVTHASRPSVKDIFGLTPSTSQSSCQSSGQSSCGSLRERSFSCSSTGSKSRLGTLRAHWPFRNNGGNSHL